MNSPTAMQPEINKKKPLFHAIYKTGNMKVFSIAFEKGAHLQEHRAPAPAILTCLKGKVAYMTESNTKVLSENEKVNISPTEVHAVKAIETSLCVLIVDFQRSID